MPIGTLLFVVVLAYAAAMCVIILVVAFHPNVKNKAPAWIFGWRPFNAVLYVFFRQDGSFRRYGRLGLVSIFGPGLVFVLLVLGTSLWAIANASR